MFATSDGYINIAAAGNDIYRRCCEALEVPELASDPRYATGKSRLENRDALNATIYAHVNNGVYRCGFAKSQASYDAAYDALFRTLDELEARLENREYLVGDRPTEADWRLFPTLVRFDLAYFSVFKCNRNRIADMPNLLRLTKALLAVPGIAATVTPRDYVLGYYSIEKCNPSGIIPRGTPVTYL